ncbi:MAG: hypothetical protein D8B54_06865 [Catonella sp.]|nr:MAG: hypothetical protein D8B54_06865 [Catonella sp.]
MSKYFIQPVITKAGNDELAAAIGSNLPITFTRVVLGSGRHTGDLKAITNVKTPAITLPALQSVLDGSTGFHVLGRLDNSNVTAETTITEIGVFAKVGSRAEVLYMYTSAEAGDLIPPRREAILVRDYEFDVRIADNGQLTVQYSNDTQNIYANRSELDAVSAKVDEVAKASYGKAEGQALAAKADKVGQDLTAHKGDKSNPHGVTKSQVGLGNVANVPQASKVEFDSHVGNTGIHVTTSDKANWNSKANGADLAGHTTNKNNPHEVTKSQVGLSNVDNVKQASKVDFDAHAGDNNRHVSASEKANWNSKASGIHSHPTNQIVGLDTKLAGYDGHIGNKNNPHGVTKAQVGLGNVSNVLQASKQEFDTLNGTVSSLVRYRLNNGGAARYECPRGTDLGTFLKGSTIPQGLYIIKDNNTGRYLRVVKQDAANIYCDSVMGEGHYIYVIHNNQVFGWQQDGPISGENSNGYWTKFPDGTLICWGLPRIDYGATVYSAINTITFPMAFIKHPGISVTPYLQPASESYKRLPGVNLVDQNLRNFSFTVGDNSGGRAGSYMWAYWIAVGRYK